MRAIHASTGWGCWPKRSQDRRFTPEKAAADVRRLHLKPKSETRDKQSLVTLAAAKSGVFFTHNGN